MIVLFDFCSIPWWLTWLLPFLLGLGIGWLIWGRYQALLKEAESKISLLNTNITNLEASLDACKKARMEAEGNVSLLRGKMREMEASAQLGAMPLAGVALAAANSPSVDKYYAAIGDTNFQIIEGIGPKMEEILKENNILNFATLASTSKEDLRTILNKYGDKYRIIDPNTWPQQASLANDRKWNELIELQKALDTGRSDTVTEGSTDSKLEKFLIKAGIIRRWQQDDLKAVEGIGPKIEELLYAKGIKTWRALAETAVSTIQEILTEAGSRFSLADPTTWPKQAEMAADGKWDELQEYQDFLQAGKEK
jgi:predicted flap endonuclease-1-like 5' DNA nuclease